MDGTDNYVGLKNYFRYYYNPNSFGILIFSLVFVITSTFLQVFFGLLVALLLNINSPIKNIIRTFSLLPWALPTTIMALGWRWIFNTPYGISEQLASSLGFPYLNILSTPSITWLATIFADIWKTTPFIALILLAGLQTIPKDLYEAFQLEGGNNKQAFLKITLPIEKIPISKK